MKTQRTKDIGMRDATMLDNGVVRVVIDDKGAMVPELSIGRAGNGRLNAHWTPHFRGNAGPFNSDVHTDFWNVELLYEIAGNFPCMPNFGGPTTVDGLELPPHGITANAGWTAKSWGTLQEPAAAYLVSSVEPSGRYQSLPLRYTKYDVLLAGHPVHYTYMEIFNMGSKAVRITAAWHNNVGAPFLSAGCRIDASADRFTTISSGGEFDTTARLAPDTDFDSLEKAPLQAGSTVDLRRVPGMIGYTDFITGAVPESAQIGWSSVVNPVIGAAYLTFFRGPAAARDDEVSLHFNDFWMQYGGRPYTPWASQNGGTDVTFCLGTENATGSYANGLAYSRAHPELLGRPTTVELGAGETKGHLYGTAFFPYEGTLDQGVSEVSWSAEGLAIRGRETKDTISVAADPEFDTVCSIAEQVGHAK